ncbi:unnamed protein product [Pleuronectes platessa]|uniref:Uncharacterized protein n=1 Tax=Pleuronectes platessa TaxID=8262 RepID=A0A9N7YGW1_PLEPL|nr:unnamed protein product [Pleuronectes platessa]
MPSSAESSPQQAQCIALCQSPRLGVPAAATAMPPTNDLQEALCARDTIWPSGSCGSLPLPSPPIPSSLLTVEVTASHALCNEWFAVLPILMQMHVVIHRVRAAGHGGRTGHEQSLDGRVEWTLVSVKVRGRAARLDGVLQNERGHKS